MRRYLLAVIALIFSLMPHVSKAQEGFTAAREIAFVYDTILRADDNLLNPGHSCTMAEAMDLLVETMTSNSTASTPTVQNYVEYFAAVPEDIIAYPMWYDGEDDPERQSAIADYHAAIEAMQRYADGNLDMFPTETIMRPVYRALMAYDDAVYEGLCVAAPYRLLAYRLLQQILLLAPSIDMIATSVSDDKEYALLDASAKSYYQRAVVSPIFHFNHHEGAWGVIMRTDLAPSTIEEVDLDMLFD